AQQTHYECAVTSPSPLGAFSGASPVSLGSSTGVSLPFPNPSNFRVRGVKGGGPVSYLLVSFNIKLSASRSRVPSIENHQLFLHQSSVAGKLVHLGNQEITTDYPLPTPCARRSNHNWTTRQKRLFDDLSLASFATVG
ncbi:MAG: hypothetical protein ACOYW4_05755, partial [Bacillota bacterium]